MLSVRFVRAALVCAALAAVPGLAFAQSAAPATPAPPSPAGAPAPPAAAPATATLAGSVKTLGGLPVAGAAVTISGPVRATATSGADGTFSVVVPPGVYTIVVAKGGFVTATQRDVAVVAGTPQPINVALAQSDLSSLRTIVSVTSGRGGSTINTGAAASTYISPQAFSDLGNPQINDVLQRAPDVNVQHMGSQADTTIVVGGAQPYETQVLIDGHPLALGQYGVWASQYFPSFLIGGAEVQSGPGNTTPFANLAVGGTVNLLTPGFTRAPSAELVAGVDSYGSQNAHFITSGTVEKLGYVAALGSTSTNGPYQGVNGCSFTPDSIANQNTAQSAGVIQFCGSQSGPLYAKGELLKLKYDFTPSTSLELGFTGAWSQFDPQGSAWGNSIGNTLVEGCLTSSPLECTNPANAGLIGHTIPGYIWYPGSSVYNNQDLFDGQFRTSLGTNTLLVRPYLANIEPEAIVGSGEGAYPAFFSPPGTTPSCPAGTSVPACAALGTTNANAFEQLCPPGTVFSYTQINSPQNTIVTKNGQEECFQYPYSAFEQDKLYGTTFSFVHPFGENYVNLTYDFHGQSTFAYFNAADNISVPLSSDRYSTISLTGSGRIARNLSLNGGIYDTRWTVTGTQPLLGADGTPVTDASGNIVETGLGRGVTRFDPHLALVFRPTNGMSYRFAYGTSATFPFVGQVSGLASYQPPSTSANVYTAGVLTEKNPNLAPEVSIGFGLGADKRFDNGSVLSVDLQNTVIHNVFETLEEGQTTPGGLFEGVLSPINVARLRSELATVKYTLAPRTGFGFSLAVAAERSIVDGLPAALYSPGVASFPVNNVQICGNGLFTPGIQTCIPYLKGYGQVTYAWKDGTFAELGVDYEGKNNTYYQPPFALVDATFRRALTHSAEIVISAENLLNTNAYNGQPAPNLGTPLVAGSADQNGNAIQTSYTPDLLPAISRTVHVSLRLHAGR